MKKLQCYSAALAFVSLFSCNNFQERTDLVDYPLSPPNILWISCEDMSPRLGCYGDEVARTPHIDQLAEEGRCYTNVYTSAPVCAPCRAGIITGMYQTSIGAHHMRVSHQSEGLPTPYETVPPHYVKTFTEYLRANGYYCVNNHKTDYQIGNPFTAWDENGPKAHYKNRPDNTQPFFAVFNIEITHERFAWGMPDSTDPGTVEVPPYYPDIPEARNTIARHYDNIALMDREVGKILSELKSSGNDKNTVVFFWSDHGDGLPRAKRWPYDSGTKIPLVIRWPEHLKAHSTDDRLISSIDFGPTVLSVAGIQVPAHMQGKAFLGDFITEEPDFVVSARDRFDESYDMMRSIRDKRYRYVRNFYPNLPYILYIPYRNNNPLMQAMLNMHAAGILEGIPAIWFAPVRPVEELYDCQSDPYNVKNLAGQNKYQNKLITMRSQLDQWMLNTGDMGKISEGEMVESMWPNGIQPTTENPQFIINSPEQAMVRIRAEENLFSAPAELTLYCPTQGASIGYTFDTIPEANWYLYAGPIKLKGGKSQIRAKAIRYGYKESEEITGKFVITE